MDRAVRIAALADRMEPAVSEALILLRAEMEHTENIILKAEIWMIFLEIYSETCLVAVKEEIFPDMDLTVQDLVKALACQVENMKGRDIRSEVRVSFHEAVFGCDRVLQLSFGEAGGKIQKIQVHIPAGIEDGKSIRLRGKGNPGYGGGAPGDLLLKVHVEPKAGWERKGADIYTTAEIPFITAVLGGEEKFSTLYGDVMCRIPAGTESGGRIRLEERALLL